MERVPRKKAKKDGKRSLLMVTLAVVLCGVAAALFLLQKHPALPDPKPVERHFLSDVEEEALKLKDMLLQRIPELKSVRLQIIGPVIGAHCGPGTLGVLYIIENGEKQKNFNTVIEIL